MTATRGSGTTDHLVRLERVLAIDAEAVWLSGWIHDAAPDHVSFSFVTPSGNVLHPLVVSFHPRPDVEEYFAKIDVRPSRGFSAYLELDVPAEGSGWTVRTRGAAGVTGEHTSPGPALGDFEAVRARALHAIQTDALDDAVMRHQVLPALTRLEAANAIGIDTVRSYGREPTVAQRSVVVPLRLIDRVEHQLIQFAGDSDFAATELIYVIPPGLVREFRHRADDWSRLYELSLVGVELTGAGSRARAYNLGASVARGEVLVFMSGDVFPNTHGWLRALHREMSSCGTTGAIAPRLLYVDGSIAHAGGWFGHDDDDGWQLTVPWAGFSATLPVTTSRGQVQALSEAFMMLRAADFALVGRFAEDYAGCIDVGAELSLRLAETGRSSWIGQVDMYWLQRSSSWPISVGPARRRLDRWIFAQRWRSLPNPEEADPSCAENATLEAAGWMERPVIIDEVVTSAVRPEDPIVGVSIDAPRPRQQDAPDPEAYAIPIQAAAVARDGRPLRLIVRSGADVLFDSTARPAAVSREGAHPMTDGGIRTEIRTVLGTLDLPTQFRLELGLLSAEDDELSVGRITGRRPQLPPYGSAELQPLLITTLGRSGSSWLALLLAQHPEIVGYRPFQNEARLASYWVAVLRALAEPASYIQAIRPEIYSARWWLGDERPSALPLRLPDARMPLWLGSANVLATAKFCAQRIGGFYRTLVDLEGKYGSRYFVEKSWPDRATNDLIAELFPRGRELILVRDFRDVLCSITAFNAKRGFAAFGSEHTDSELGLIQNLRADALRLHDRLQDAGDRALVVRYEDLIRQPEQTVGGILAHAQIDSEPRLVRSMIDAARSCLPHAQLKHQTSSSVFDSLGRWKKDLSPASKAASATAFESVLEAFGYSPG